MASSEKTDMGKPFFLAGTQRVYVRSIYKDILVVINIP